MGKLIQLLKFAVRRLDFFGVPITFTGSHRLKYQTKLGGIISIVFLSYVFLICYQQLSKVISRVEMEIQTNVLFDENPKVLNINAHTFAFAFKIENYNLTDASYFSAKMYLMQMNYDSASRSRSYIELVNITYEPCTLAHFQSLDYYNAAMNSELKVLGIRDYHCPSFDDLKIFGRFTSQQFQYLRLDFHMCREGSGCAPL